MTLVIGMGLCPDRPLEVDNPSKVLNLREEQREKIQLRSTGSLCSEKIIKVSLGASQEANLE